MLPYNIFDFENHLFFLSIYVLCFIYLFQVNTEYPSMILLALLNFVYILVHFISVSETNVKILGFEVPLRVIILIIWLVKSLSIMHLIKTLKQFILFKILNSILALILIMFEQFL